MILSPFYQYKLTLTVTPGGARCFKLRDRCCDCYELGCSFGTTHVVRFNSRSPSIIGVECRVGKWSGGQRAAVAVALPLVACAAVAPPADSCDLRAPSAAARWWSSSTTTAPSRLARCTR